MTDWAWGPAEHGFMPQRTAAKSAERTFSRLLPQLVKLVPACLSPAGKASGQPRDRSYFLPSTSLSLSEASLPAASFWRTSL